MTAPANAGKVGFGKDPKGLNGETYGLVIALGGGGGNIRETPGSQGGNARGKVHSLPRMFMQNLLSKLMNRR